jgi:filamentous hemagglutinin family protein
MPQNQRFQLCGICFTGAIASSLLFASSATVVRAQIAGDGSVGTQVNGSLTAPCTGACTINGGTERGVNLYHSFQEFSIPANGQAWFNNAPQIQTIFTRVTGHSISAIDGLIKANGSANLFFLNPNGIVFGPNAQLRIGGSFFASTANHFKFADGSEFSATNPQAPPLLTIHLTPGLQAGVPQGNIRQTGNLEVPAEHSLTLLGSTVTHTGRLTAPSGTVQIVGSRVALLEQARVDVSGSTGGGTVLIGGDYQGQGTVPRATQTVIGTNVTINADATGQGNGGKVIVWADGATRFYGNISARGGQLGGDGGFVEVSGAQNLNFHGRVDTTASFGHAGILLLDPTNITVVAGATPIPSNAADGIWSTTEDAGNQTIGADAIATLLETNQLTLEATDTIRFTPNANVLANSPNTLTLHARTITLTNVLLLQRGAGNVILDTTQNRGTLAQTTQGTSVLVNNSIIGTENVGAVSQTGNLQVTTGSLSAVNGGQLTASTFSAGTTGNAGSVRLAVNGAAVFDGMTPNGRFSSGAFSTVEPGAIGTGGNVDLTADTLTLTNGARLDTSTFGRGNAGSLKLTVNGATTLDGVAQNGVLTLMRSQVGRDAIGNGGNIELTTGSLTVTNGAQLSVSTFSTDRTSNLGNAGSIKLAVNGAAIFDGMTPNGRFSSGTFSTVELGAIGQGGTIELVADTLILRHGARLDTSTFGRGNAGTIQVKLDNDAILDGVARNGVLTLIRSQVGRTAIGNGGNIELAAGSLTVTNGAQLSASTFSTSRTSHSGNAGSVKLTVTGAAVFDGTSPNSRFASGALSTVERGAIGKGGRVELTANRLIVTNGAQLLVSTAGIGESGNIKLRVMDATTFAGTAPNGQFTSGAFSGVRFGALGQGGTIDLVTGDLFVTHGAQLSASTAGRGDAGNITLTVTDVATFDGTGLDSQAIRFPSGVFSTVQATGNGKGGRIDLVAGTLLITRGAQLSTGTAGVGDAGNLKLRVMGTATVDGALDDGLYGRLPSGVFSSVQAGATGRGGTIELVADRLSITRGAQFGASTFGTGDAGNILVAANHVEAASGGQLVTTTFNNGEAGDITLKANAQVTLTGTSTGLFANTSLGSAGNGGNIFIEPQRVQVVDGATIAVNSQGRGTGGNIVVQAGRLELRDRGSITAETTSTQGGNIIINASDPVILRRNSLISATAGTAAAGGDGGNIHIRAPFIIGVRNENSDITANAFTGQGGNITIDTNAIYGLQFQPRLTPFSDITASSEFGLSGTVAINTLNIDPNRGLVALPLNLSDPSQRIAQDCKPGGTASSSSFVATGRGGIPLSPDESLESHAGNLQWVPLPKDENNSSHLNTERPKIPNPIVEAQGWIVRPDGTVVLVAELPIQYLRAAPVFCQPTTWLP